MSDMSRNEMSVDGRTKIVTALSPAEVTLNDMGKL